MVSWLNCKILGRLTALVFIIEDALSLMKRLAMWFMHRSELCVWTADWLVAWGDASYGHPKATGADQVCDGVGLHAPR